MRRTKKMTVEVRGSETLAFNVMLPLFTRYFSPGHLCYKQKPSLKKVSWRAHRTMLNPALNHPL